MIIQIVQIYSSGLALVCDARFGKFIFEHESRNFKVRSEHGWLETVLLEVQKMSNSNVYINTQD